jgi:hypothetical protein
MDLGAQIVGLLSLGIGSMIYSYYCPHIVKKHGDFSDYVRIDGPSLSIEATRELARGLGYDDSNRLFELDGLCIAAKPDIMHRWYAALSSDRRWWRAAVAVLFAVGFILLSIPSAISAIKIGGLLLGA